MLLKLPLDVVRLILELCKPLDKIMIKLSCKRLNSIIPTQILTMYMTSCASFEGYLNILKYLHFHAHKWNYNTGQYAAIAGHLSIIKYLHENECTYNECDIVSEDIMYIACNFGHLEIVKYLDKHKLSNDESNIFALALANATQYGYLEIVQYLYQNGYPIISGITDWAARTANLEVLKYLREIGCKWTGHEISNAIENHNLESVKYLHQMGCEFTEDHVDVAARFNNLEMLQYLHQNGYLFTQTNLNNAFTEEIAAYIRERMI
jgi:hypothetical protein